PHRDLHSFPTRRSSDLLIGTIVLLFSDIPFFKLRHAITSLASPASSPTRTVTVAPSLMPTEASSTSESTPASPMPSVTATPIKRSEEHTSELQSRSDLV